MVNSMQILWPRFRQRTMYILNVDFVIVLQYNSFSWANCGGERHLNNGCCRIINLFMLSHSCYGFVNKSQWVLL